MHFMALVLTLLTAAVLTIVVAVIWKVVRRKKGKKLSISANIIIFVALIPLSGVVGFLGYTASYYHADESVKAYLVSSDTVEVVKYAGGYMFDGPGEDTAVIFYPGGKVQDISYAPLLYRIAESGTDCFLIHMPRNMAFLGLNAADGVMSQYEYEHYYLAGHSLGGAMAAAYCSHADRPEGLILLAAYAADPLPDDLRTIVFIGSEDGCVNRDAFENGKQNLPADARIITIEGGNHAGFGFYGAQDGDGEASVTPEEQQSITLSYITEFLNIA